MSKSIIFFDGYCNLCNKAVNWVLSKDKKGVFQFASLQGSTAQTLISKQTESLDSIVLYHENKIFTHYRAVGMVYKQLPFPYSLGIIFYLLPNFIYNWIAKNRYRWFGKRDTCRIPSSAEKERFLD